MSVQILGGRFKGFSVQVPKLVSRPTSVMLRRRIFDRQQNLQGFTFFDGCAGSGAMGFEALSRGAENVTFVEADSKAALLIKKNIQALEQWARLSPGELDATVRSTTVQNYLSEWRLGYLQMDNSSKRNAILFFDPPYQEHGIYQEVKKIFFESDFFHGQLWIESDSKKGVPQEFWPSTFPPTKIIKQGESYLAIFCFE